MIARDASNKQSQTNQFLEYWGEPLKWDHDP